MAAGCKTGGSQKGTPNKRTAGPAERLEERGCDPVAALVEITPRTPERHANCGCAFMAICCRSCTRGARPWRAATRWGFECRADRKGQAAEPLSCVAQPVAPVRAQKSPDEGIHRGLFCA